MTQTITRDELKAGLDSGAITAVDALPESYYSQMHLPRAGTSSATRSPRAPASS